MTAEFQDYQITRLGSSDIAQMRELISMFAKAFDDDPDYTENPPSSDYLKNILDDETFFALAALKENTIAGGLVAYELKKFEQQRSEIYIYDLAVDAQHRLKGVATSLIDGIRQLAKSRNAYVMFIQADADNDPAISLYSKLGAREDAIHFDIAVGKADDT